MHSLNFQMQVCRNCEHHKWCTRHKEKRYQSLAAEIKSRLQSLDDNVVVKEVPNPTIGSFEIKCNGKILFSKLKLGYFPHTEMLMERINQYLNKLAGKENKTSLSNPILKKPSKFYVISEKNQIYEQKRKEEEKKKQEQKKKEEEKKKQDQKKKEEEKKKQDQKKKEEEKKKQDQKKKEEEKKKQNQKKKEEEKKKQDQKKKEEENYQEEVFQQQNKQIEDQVPLQNDYEQQFQKNPQNLKHFFIIKFKQVQIIRKTDFIGKAQPYWIIQSKNNTKKGKVNQLQQKFKIQFNPVDDTFINLKLMDQDVNKSQLIAQFVFYLNKIISNVDNQIKFDQQMKFQGQVAAKIMFSTIYKQISTEPWTIKIINALIDIDTELFGKMDPFVNITFGQQKFRTNVDENGGKTPKWNQSFNIYVQNQKTQQLQLQVLQSDVTSNDVIGKAIIPFRELVNEKKYSGKIINNNKKVGQIIVQANRR